MLILMLLVGKLLQKKIKLYGDYLGIINIMIKNFLRVYYLKDVGDPSDIAVTNEWARAFITLIL